MSLIKSYENVFIQAPYLHASVSSKRMMFDVFLMLILTCISAVILFGLKVFFILAIGIMMAFICAYFIKLQDRSFFMSSFAWINGVLILILMLPVTVSWFIPILGVLLYFFNYLVFKIKSHQIFHPALLAKLILYLLFPSVISEKPPTLFQIMNQYSVNWLQANSILFNQDFARAADSTPSLWGIFWGNLAGNMGETSLILLLISLFYLGICNVFFILILLIYLGTLFLLTVVFSGFLNKNLFSLDMFNFLFQNGTLFFSVFILSYFGTQPILISRKIWAAFLSAVGIFILKIQGIWLAQIVIFLLMGAITPIFDIWPNHPYFGYQKNMIEEKYYFSWNIFIDKIKSHSFHLVIALCIMITIYLLNILSTAI
ncbi:NQR2, RnfD, RnfE family [Brevinema andersonii]|uniref:NQR2, RnfD, RnfE family n=1 Tax=Brevinema andersonii TaxID=34097 RepID=A0A1I1DMM9_BREAD|nr:RnfABCDGE type electron transport complex subunit D [Brevinema andersonii]SFB75696.1 NQR2, RnfD, RnfE family [Brevinema andersonii]